ncbi:MAG: outer membrane protein assembly factor BamD [Candidatus Neomarinimicrobiota bacterium]
MSFSLIAFNCAGNKPVNTDLDAKANYDKGMEMLQKKRYLRAQEEFNQAVISGAHTEWGDDASFYLGEAYFLNKEYLLAISEYERLIRRMPFTEYLERARYRICECYIAESPDFFHDQTYTLRAIEEIQEFLDDFPISDFRAEALTANNKLREKLGQKSYETGILYLKMDEPKPAIVAFEDVINNYYDTRYFKLSHLEIVNSYCLIPDIAAAEQFIKDKEQIFTDDDLLSRANAAIKAARTKLEKTNQ